MKVNNSIFCVMETLPKGIIPHGFAHECNKIRFRCHNLQLWGILKELVFVVKNHFESRLAFKCSLEKNIFWKHIFWRCKLNSMMYPKKSGLSLLILSWLYVILEVSSMPLRELLRLDSTRIQVCHWIFFIMIWCYCDKDFLKLVILAWLAVQPATYLFVLCTFNCVNI